ncbi:unnamed protein product [Lactuca saligna]|uniref:Uncharacterized protein n=1 Tax=Lactuca saligna TaxID=75948 RepID=A0AA35YRQ1_LACSI|nr:unnamed protein product [Lactuca saligna]
MSNRGQLHCGGMVSIIVEHLGLHIPNNPTNIIPGRTHLSLEVLEIMHLFHRHPNGDVHWTVDAHRPSTTTSTPLAQTATAGASSSSCPIPYPEHKLYMGEFARLDHQYMSLQQEVGEIYTGVAEITSDFHDHRNLQGERWAQQEPWWAEQDQRWIAQEQHNRNIHYFMSDLRRVLVLPTQQQPPSSQPQWHSYYHTDYPSQFPPYPPPPDPQ